MPLNPTIALIWPGAIGTTIAAALHEVVRHAFAGVLRIRSWNCATMAARLLSLGRCLPIRRRVPTRLTWFFCGKGHAD